MVQRGMGSPNIGAIVVNHVQVWLQRLNTQLVLVLEDLKRRRRNAAISILGFDPVA